MSPPDVSPHDVSLMPDHNKGRIKSIRFNFITKFSFAPAVHPNRPAAHMADRIAKSGQDCIIRSDPLPVILRPRSSEDHSDALN